MLDSKSTKIRAQWFPASAALTATAAPAALIKKAVFFRAISLCIVLFCAVFQGCLLTHKTGALEKNSPSTMSSLVLAESDWRQPPGQTQTTTSGAKSNHVSRRNNGSAAVLSGTVCLFEIYVSDDASSWPLKELAEVGKRLRDTRQFILDQARLYHITVRFAPETSVTIAYTGTIPTDMWANPTWTETVIQRAAKLAGDSCNEENLKSANDLMRFLKKTYGADQALALIHVNKSSTSYNLTYYNGVGAMYQAERSVVFMRYAIGTPTCAASYVHEILHNFGAGELYFPFDKDSVRKDQAKKIWPNEIMYRVDYNLGKLSIGEYTAYRIGWLDWMNPEYRKFDD